MSVARKLDQPSLVELSTLPGLPQHWGLMRVGSVFDERNERVSDTDYEPLSVTMRGIVPRLDTAAKTDAGDNRKKVLPGDLVINSRSDRRGSSGVSGLRGSVSLICTVLKPIGILPEFAHHLVRSSWFQEEFFRFGRGIVDDLWSTKYSDMKLIQLPLPPDGEQRAIAAFLDRETARIDALIEKKQRLIELLKEKRQAVITQAVTRGLDPDVPLRDSGVEWLGAIPAHWGVARVKHVARLESGHTPSKQIPEYWEDCTIPWVSLQDSKQMREVDWIRDTAQMINELGIAGSSARLLPTNSVVFTRDASIGLAAITAREMAVSQHLIAWVPGRTVSPEYLLRVFNVMEPFLDSLTAGATIKTIGMDDVRQLVTPLPPRDEQEQICTFVLEIRDTLGRMIALTQQSVDLLRERRSALITAAVTGQIDVRDAA